MAHVHEDAHEGALVDETTSRRARGDAIDGERHD